MVGWHHLLNGHEFEQAPGDDEEQESLACCSPWGHKESDTTKQLKNNNYIYIKFSRVDIFIFGRVKSGRSLPVLSDVEELFVILLHSF